MKNKIPKTAALAVVRPAPLLPPSEPLRSLLAELYQLQEAWDAGRLNRYDFETGMQSVQQRRLVIELMLRAREEPLGFGPCPYQGEVRCTTLSRL
jgi:hypothetical protein